MKKNFKNILKPLSFLPALAMMYIIYSFSAQTGEASGSLSYEISYKTVQLADELLGTGLDPQQLESYAHKIEHPIRKLAHMTEYFLLALTVSFPFYVYGLRGRKLMLTAALICVAFAARDEYHQSFVDGRGPSVKDVLIDSAGVLIGTLFVRILCLPSRTSKSMKKQMHL